MVIQEGVIEHEVWKTLDTLERLPLWAAVWRLASLHHSKKVLASNSVPMWVLSMWNLYVLPMSGASFHIDLCRGETVVSGQGVLPYPSEFSGVSG